MYRACHSRSKRRQSAQQILQEAAPATQEAAGAQSATRRAAARSGGFGYCACHATASRDPNATRRAAAPSGGSGFCACHATVSCLGRGSSFSYGSMFKNQSRSLFWGLVRFITDEWLLYSARIVACNHPE